MSGKVQNNVKRRIISVLLTAAMLAGVLPAGQAWAEGDPERNGPEVQVDELVLPDTLTKSAGYPFFAANIRRIVMGNGMTEIPSIFSAIQTFCRKS